MTAKIEYFEFGRPLASSSDEHLRCGKVRLHSHICALLVNLTLGRSRAVTQVTFFGLGFRDNIGAQRINYKNNKKGWT